MIIGLTGGYCAGKNAVAAVLEERGCFVIDVDKIGHAALEAERERIVASFGPGVLKADGSVDRRVLSARVFGDRAALARLEGIVHPAANRMTEKLAREHADRIVVVNAALLYRMPIAGQCDFIIVVKAPLLTRIRRGRRRDGLSLCNIIQRMWRQRALRPQRSLKNVDRYTVENAGNACLLEQRVERLLARKGI